MIIRHWNVCKIHINGVSKKIASSLFHTGSLFWNSACFCNFSSLDSKPLASTWNIGLPLVPLYSITQIIDGDILPRKSLWQVYFIAFERGIADMYPTYIQSPWLLLSLGVSKVAFQKVACYTFQSPFHRLSLIWAIMLWSRRKSFHLCKVLSLGKSAIGETAGGFYLRWLQ